MADFGFAAMVLAFAMSLYAAAAALLGAYRRSPELLASGRNGALVVALLLTAAVSSLAYLLAVGDFQTRYVAEVSNRAMPMFYRLTSVWGAQAGSLLFWSWIMSVFGGAAIMRKWEGQRESMPYVIAVIMVTLAFFLSLNVFVENPFEQLDFRPEDGQGLNPLLRHPGMIIHPPALYLGFVGFVIPYAFAIAALITGNTGDTWIRTTRRWTLFAWLFLSLGLLLGGWWAYDVLSWGGYWNWDPVENAALIPWLIATPFLHSVVIQERRGMFKVLNTSMVILTYCLVIFGTFLTRSGVIGSVHSFAQSAIGPLFLGFVGAMFLFSVILLFDRYDSLAGENELDSYFSRESAFMLVNLLFWGIAFAVFWGTIFPVLSEAVTGDKIIVGPPFFEQVTGPLFLAILVLMGVGPLLGWRRSSPKKLLGRVAWAVGATALLMAALYVTGAVRAWQPLAGIGACVFTSLTTLEEFWRGARALRKEGGVFGYPPAFWRLFGRNRRRYGGYLVHVGVIMVSLGIIGTHFYQTETQKNVSPGESIALGPYELTYLEIHRAPSDADVISTEAVLSVYKNGRPVGELRPRNDFYVFYSQPMTIPAVRSTAVDDLYAVLAGWEEGGASATFKVYINPLVNWLWGGGAVFILGTLVAAWPARRGRSGGGFS